MTTPVAERAFDKYETKGAYHWRDLEGGPLRMNAYSRARYALVAEALAPLQQSATVLDAGCGDGALSGYVHRHLKCRTVGVDTSDLAIFLARAETAKRGYDCRFERIDGYAYPFEDAAFDAAFCSDVIEHVADPQALLREISRVLKPGGRLIISTPIRLTERPVDPNHVHEWFPEEFVDLCRPVFGAPVARILSHPAFWYEVYALDRRLVGNAARFAINLSTWFGWNPFLDRTTRWRCMTTQFLVLRKP